ncbi:MAG TPA: hypothetical protein VF054_05015 [Micromonosporaceae bacterium]
MTVAYHGVPWTEEDYLALGQTLDRIELFDGGLVVTPAPTPWHQHVSRRLANVLDGAATLRLYRLEDGRYAQEAVGRPGQPLRLVDPVKVEIDPMDLVPGR